MCCMQVLNFDAIADSLPSEAQKVRLPVNIPVHVPVHIPVHMSVHILGLGSLTLVAHVGARSAKHLPRQGVGPDLHVPNPMLDYIPPTLIRRAVNAVSGPSAARSPPPTESPALVRVDCARRVFDAGARNPVESSGYTSASAGQACAVTDEYNHYYLLCGGGPLSLSQANHLVGPGGTWWDLSVGGDCTVPKRPGQK